MTLKKSDVVRVLKRDELEYVILLPETISELETNPTVTVAEDVIKSIEVTSQPYAGNLKGYTKVTIRTFKPILIDAKTVVATPNSIARAKKAQEKLEKERQKQLEKQTKQKPQPAVKTEPVKKEQAVESKKETTTTPTAAEKPVAPVEPIGVEVADTKKADKSIVDTKKKSLYVSSVITGILLLLLLLLKRFNKKHGNVAPKQNATTTTEPEQFVANEIELPIHETIEHKLAPETAENDANDELEQIINEPIEEEIVEQPVAEPVVEEPDVIEPPVTEPTEDIVIEPTENIVEENTDESLDEIAQETVQNEVEPQVEGPEMFSGFEQAENNLEPQANETSLFESFAGVEPIFDDEVVNEPAIETIDEANTVEPINTIEAVDEIAVEESSVAPIEVIPFEKAVPAFAEVLESVEDDDDSDEDSQESTTDDGEPRELIRDTYSLTPSKKLYLVDYESATVLMASVKDEFFVLKNFEEIIDKPLQLRQTEKTSKLTSYIVRVGHFRGVVHVTHK
ncbi:hypothetical protein IJV79_01130, partial [bacterium]|nr:hypothetical protein [bacterium]